jgi:hypothetical protein
MRQPSVDLGLGSRPILHLVSRRETSLLGAQIRVYFDHASPLGFRHGRRRTETEREKIMRGLGGQSGHRLISGKARKLCSAGGSLNISGVPALLPE